MHHEPQFIHANHTPNDTERDVLQIASPFAYHYYQKNQQLVEDFIKRFALTDTLGTSVIDGLVAEYTQGIDDEAGVMQALRRLRQVLMVRWIWQDALAVIDLEELTFELASFANSVICFAKDFVYDKLKQRFGEPYYKAGKTLKKDEFAIIAMGKLGAMELNLSSDIDLIFIHQGKGETDGKKCVDNQKFMTQLGRGVIKLIDENTADGFVFRVDMRLRPWGDGSPLVMTDSALVKYFENHGRTWERFAWLKARVVNPISEPFLARLADARKNFVFRHYVDYSTFSALREMRMLITNQVAQREDLDNVKLGVGGIRDVEFIAQSFALIYAGKFPILMEQTMCLQALNNLANLGLIPQETADDLSQAYRFLRRLEHAIQARHDAQTQRLPADEGLTAIAYTLGFDSAKALREQLEYHRQKVSVPFDKMVTKREYVQGKVVPINHKQDWENLHTHLSDEAKGWLDDFWQSKLVQSLSDEAKDRLNKAYPVMIHALWQYAQNQGDVSIVVPRLIKILESICRRSIYLVMFSENPDSTTDLIPMLAQSPWIAGELASYPVLLDNFLQKRYRHLPDKAELKAILEQSLLSVASFDDESFLMSIRLFKKTQVLAVASSDVLRHHPIMKVSDSLTFISEVVLESCLTRAFFELTQKHGYPMATDGTRLDLADCGFAIVGYGKLGGIEMSYASDLDVVFLHRVAEQEMTDGKTPISGMKFATRLVQKLINYLTTQTRDGRVYELDMRLRPSGNAGVMVISTTAFDLYQQEKAWVWEHQALVRARGICGDKQVLDSFNKTRLQILQKARDVATLKQEVLDMREKMRSHLSNSNPDKFHLKQDAGGLVDIEFIAQYGVLKYAHDYPDMAIWSDNVRIFEMAGKLGVWDKSVCQDLDEAYLQIRKQTHIQALADQKSLVDNEPWQACRQRVIAIWQQIFGE